MTFGYDDVEVGFRFSTGLYLNSETMKNLILILKNVTNCKFTDESV